MKVSITNIFSLEMAHALFGYDGACKNIHGHTYHLEVTVTGEPMNSPGHPKDGMVMDFSELKKIIQENVLNSFDHSLVLNANSPHKNTSELKNHFEKIIYSQYQPTCENLLTDMKSRIETSLPQYVRLNKVLLRETENSFAEWIAEK